MRKLKKCQQGSEVKLNPQMPVLNGVDYAAIQRANPLTGILSPAATMAPSAPVEMKNQLQFGMNYGHIATSQFAQGIAAYLRNKKINRDNKVYERLQSNPLLQTPFNPNTTDASLYGDVLMKKGGPSPTKAAEMLRDGTANKKKLTKKQIKYFQCVAHGGCKKQEGGPVEQEIEDEIQQEIFKEDQLPTREEPQVEEPKRPDEGLSEEEMAIIMTDPLAELDLENDGPINPFSTDEEPAGEVATDAVEKFKSQIARSEGAGYFDPTSIKDEHGKPASSAFGRYQFVKGTRQKVRDLYYKDIPRQDFENMYKSSPLFQEEVMSKYSGYLLDKFKDPRKAATAFFLGEGAADMHNNPNYRPTKGNATVGEYLGRGKFQKGGKVENLKSVTVTGRAPIRVTDPNDPRLKAYQDSLNLYSGSKKAYEVNLKKEMEIKNKQIDDINAHKNPGEKKLERYNLEDFYDYGDARGGTRPFDFSKMSPIGLETWDDGSKIWTMKTGDPGQDILTEDNFYATRSRLPIKPTHASINSDGMIENAFYKKPTQPVIYKPLTTVAPSAGVNKPTIGERNFPVSAQSMSSTGDYSINWRDEQGNQQSSFMDKTSWKNFLKNYPAQSVTEKQGSGHALYPAQPMQKGGITPKQFFLDYINSPKYKERLNKQGYDNASETQRIRTSAIKNARINDSTGLGSYYDVRENEVYVDPQEVKSYYQNKNTTIAHELSHAAGAMSPITGHPAPLNNTEETEIGKRNVFYNPDILKQGHDGRPVEMKADIDALRYRLKVDGLYDAGTQDMDMELLKKIKSKYKNDANHGRLLFNTSKSDEDLLWLMNNIAQNDTTKPTEAKKGGWIQKAVNPEHKGYCTPMTKSTCTPRRKALAKRFKAMAKHQEGGEVTNDISRYQEGGSYYIDEKEIARLKRMGYEIE